MLEILYQDEYLIAINKPAGWLVHRSWLDKHETVFVMQTLRDQIGQHVFPVHRLDRPTSGVLVFALSSEVARLLSQQFEAQTVTKIYHAIVRGYLTDQNTIDYPLVKELDKIADKFANKEQEAQTAISHYKGISKIEIPVAVGRYETARYSFVELSPQTGRKHQLRRHMSHIFHPMIGDSRHGDLNQNRAFADYFGIKRLMLHSSSIEFSHPITGQKLLIKTAFDADWLHLLSKFT